jgi:hypothetical protein
MGTVLFVNSLAAPDTRLVLKYCNRSDDDTKNRFRREVRVMQSFNGSHYVAPVIDANLDHSPPYFIMPFFEHGDLTHHAAHLRQDLAVAEQYFNRMIDCIEQLHNQGVFHRDIKPQNFLVGNGTLVVSDLGLCVQPDSPTAFTRSSVYGGTPGYMPPGFLAGGFRHADASDDIYMLGKTFFVLLSGLDAPELISGLLPAPIFVVIERACAQDKVRRYQTLAALRQSLALAFNVVLGRAIGSGGVLGTQQAIVDRWQSTNQTDLAEFGQFIDELAMLSLSDRHRVCIDIPADLFHAVAHAPLPPGRLASFIQAYLEMATQAEYGWSFAETIADNMAILFHSPLVFEADKADALKAAIIAADRQNRFAAMDTCKAMIASVHDAGLAHRVYELMIENPSYFLENMDPLTCRSPAVRQAIATLKANAEAAQNQSELGNPFPT